MTLKCKQAGIYKCETAATKTKTATASARDSALADALVVATIEPLGATLDAVLSLLAGPFEVETVAVSEVAVEVSPSTGVAPDTVDGAGVAGAGVVVGTSPTGINVPLVIKLVGAIQRM
jgi:hypothetical protein